MKLKSKKLKGMTLIEIIISMLIFTLLASIMVQVGSVTKSLMMNTNHLNNKTNAEAPIAAVQDADELRAAAAVLPTETDASSNVVAYDATEPVTITVSAGTFRASVNAAKYSTAAMALASDLNCDTSKHMNGDLEFYVIEDATEPTT